MLRPEFSVLFMSVRSCTLERSTALNKPHQLFQTCSWNAVARCNLISKVLWRHWGKASKAAPLHRAKWSSGMFSDKSPNQHLAVVIGTKWLIISKEESCFCQERRKWRPWFVTGISLSKKNQGVIGTPLSLVMKLKIPPIHLIPWFCESEKNSYFFTTGICSFIRIELLCRNHLILNREVLWNPAC